MRYNSYPWEAVGIDTVINMSKRILITILFAATLSAGLAFGATAKSYRIESVTSDVHVETSGYITVEEEITYLFDGSYTFAYRDIPLTNGQLVIDITVSETGRAYRESHDKSPGTFAIAHQSGNTRVTWFYRANSERRTFKFSYRLWGAVHLYPDVAELYYKFVGDGWSQWIGRVDAVVHLPASMDTTGVRAWAHGPRHGKYRFESDRIVFSVKPLPPRRFWEGRVLMPPDMFQSMELTSSVFMRGRIFSQERNWALRAEGEYQAKEARRAAWRERRLRRQQAQGLDYMNWSVVAYMVMTMLLCWWMWWTLCKYGREHEVTQRYASGGLPSEHPPAVVSYLMFKPLASTALPSRVLVATLLDLADRGFLKVKVEKRVKTKKGMFGREKVVKDFRFQCVGGAQGDLLAYESDLLFFLLNEAGNGSCFTMSDVKKLARQKRTEFRRWFRKWTTSVEEYSNNTFGFYEPMNGWAIWPRRTLDGQRLFLDWLEFKNHLKQLKRGMGSISLGSRDWSRYLGAAIIFGMHKEVVPNLRLNDSNSHYVPIWYSGVADGNSSSGIESLTSGLSSMVTSVSSTVSSLSGTGCGASGGGGCGGAGGAGGAGGGGGGAG